MSERKYKVGDIEPVDEDGTPKHEITSEEAIKRLMEILAEATESEDSVCYVTEEDREPLEMAIKALERQKDINIKCEQCPYGEVEVRNICNYDGHGCGWD